MWSIVRLTRNIKSAADNLADGFRRFPVSTRKPITFETGVGIGNQRCCGEQRIVWPIEFKVVKVIEPLGQNRFGILKALCKERVDALAKFRRHLAGVLGYGLFCQIDMLDAQRNKGRHANTCPGTKERRLLCCADQWAWWTA